MSVIFDNILSFASQVERTWDLVRDICYYSPLVEVGVLSTEIKKLSAHVKHGTRV